MDGKTIHVEVGTSDIVPTWLDNATKKMPDGNNNGVKPKPPEPSPVKGDPPIDPPEGDNIANTPWYKSIDGKKIKVALAKGLQYPFPTLSTAFRVLISAAKGGKNWKDAWNVIGHKGNKRQIRSHWHERKNTGIHKWYGKTYKNLPELIIRAEVEHFIYVTGYLSYQGWPTPAGEPDLSPGEKFMVIGARMFKNHVVVGEFAWENVNSIWKWLKTDKGYCLSKYDGDRMKAGYKKCMAEMAKKKAQLKQFKEDLELVSKYATDTEGMCEDGDYETALKRINTTYDDTKQNFLKSEDMGLLVKAVKTVTGVDLKDDVSGDELWKTLNGGVDDATFKSTMTERMNIYNEYCLNQKNNQNFDPDKSIQQNKTNKTNKTIVPQTDSDGDFVHVELPEIIIEGARVPLASMNVCVMEVNPIDLISEEDFT